MINYQYQILRYLPDQVNEEFVNLGVVVLDDDRRILRFRFLDKASRVSGFFPDVNTRYLNNTLKFLQGEFYSLSKRLSQELALDKKADLEGLTRSILPKDDSSLIFSGVKRGRDVSIELACDDLYNRVVVRNVADSEEMDLRYDREVWSKIYKTYFEKYQITSKLQPHTVKTVNDSLQFERAWKNGKWNCFETVSFNLTRKDAVKNKVYKWVGKLDELKTSDEPVNLYLLSVLPKSEDLKLFIDRKLNNKDFDKSTVTVITEEEVEVLARKFQREIEAH
jgi:hypothetical protein